MSPDLQADLTADLLRDLEGPDSAAAKAPGPSGPRSTPALSLTLTPLQWSWPVVRRPATGRGVVVAVGPWRLDLAA